MVEGMTGVLNLDLVGGYLCLNFTNTVHSYDAESPRDELATFDDLVLWSHRVGAVGEEDADALLADARAHPGKAQSVLWRARALRTVIYRIFAAIAGGEEPRKADLKKLSDLWSEAAGRGQLTRGEEGFEWAWESRRRATDKMFWPIVRSAVDLLTSGEIRNVRKCKGDTCTWLFIDKSRNHSRLWCEMSSCGNRAKSRRYYARRRSRSSS